MTYLSSYWPGPQKREKPAHTIVMADPYVDAELRPYLRAGSYVSATLSTSNGSIFYIAPSILGVDTVEEGKHIVEKLDIYGINLAGTYGRTGKRLLYRGWNRTITDKPYRMHRGLSPSVARYFRENMVGGRQELFDARMDGDVEIDQKFAYLQHFQRLPDLCARCLSDPGRDAVTYFMECTVYPDMAALCPVPIHRTDTKVHRYEITSNKPRKAYLWKEEVELARDCGWNVIPESGYAFRDWTEDTMEWSQTLIDLKEKEEDPIVKNALKRIGSDTVSTLARSSYPKLIRMEDAQFPGDVPALSSVKGVIPYAIREVESSRPCMAHWYSYVMMRTRLASTKLAMDYEKKGLVRIYVDAVNVRKVLYPIPDGFTVKAA